MLYFRVILVAVCALLMSCFGQKVFAGDNGVFKLELPDAAAVGMGGAFVGESDRPSAVYYNPAGITQMDTPEVSAGLTWAQPQAKFESASANNGETSKMREENYLFPNVFITTPIIKDKFYLGIGESSDFGGGNSWEANGFSEYSTVKDSLTNQDYRIVGAYKVNNQWSFAAGAVSDQSAFEHSEAINQTGAPTGNGNGLFKANDDAWGYNLAAMFKLNDQNQFGLDYKSSIHHTYDGSILFSNLFTGAGLGGLIGSSSYSTRAIQKLTLPQSVTLGYSLKPISKLTLNFDLEWTDWSQYKAQITTYPNASPAIQGALASSSYAARDWTAVWSESVGAEYAATDKLKLRLGYEHHQTPVPEANYDTEFPDSDSNAVTVGFGYDLTSKLTLDVAYVADFYSTRNVVNSLDSGGLSGKYSEFVNIATASLTYKF